MVPAYSLLLFGGVIEVLHQEKQVVVDKWVKFEAPAKVAVLFRELRVEVCCDLTNQRTACQATFQQLLPLGSKADR